ncbi:MAG: alpha/beta fold hydrolase, partial [Promethearchaeota archaeon]
SLNPQKKTVIFIHGAGGSHLTWESQKSLENEFNFITVDLPGHGEAEGEAVKTLKDYAQVLHQGIHQEFSELIPLILVGHSMAGGILQHYALMYPDDLLGIVLIDTGAKLRVMNQILDQLPENFEEVVEIIVQYAFHRETDTQIVEKVKEQFLSCSPLVMLQDFKACNSFDLFNEIKNISIPTLIICGSDDLLTPPKFSKFLQTNIPDSKFVEIPEAGHMTMLEKPIALKQALKSFIKRL